MDALIRSMDWSILDVGPPQKSLWNAGDEKSREASRGSTGVKIKRIVSRELLDEGLVAPEELPAILDDIWRINRWFGGISGSLKLLDRFFTRTGGHAVRILDVGAGDGRLAAILRQQLKERSIESKFFVLDRQWSHISAGHASKNGLNRVVGDAFDLPFRPASFEIVMCNLFLHHFSGQDARKVLGAMTSIATEAVLINDLDRRWLPYLIIRLAPLLVRTPAARRDGIASVRQAYTSPELIFLAKEAGMGNFEVTKLPFFRHGLICWKTAAGA